MFNEIIINNQVFKPYISETEGYWIDESGNKANNDVLQQIEAKIKELEAQAKIDAKYDSCKNYILQHYSTTKQQSDQADKEYFSTLLKANGAKDLETEIVLKVQDFFKGATLESLVKDVPTENKEAYIQLIKVGIRVTWVQMCKQELKKAIEEDREPNFPEYPL